MTISDLDVAWESRTTPEVLNDLAHLQQDPPVDVRRFAETLGIAVWEDEMPAGTSGKLFRDKANGGHSGYSIVVNSNEGYRRERFTIAHEVAHFMLHRNLGKDVVDDTLYRSGLSSKQETDANALAAAILMPYSLIEKLQRQGVTSVQGLADRLKVSEAAIMVRLGIPLP